MCLAIYKPAGVEIPVKHLENGFENHSDGAGMAWAVDGQLHVKKGMFKVEEVLDLYEQIKQYPALIHFRKATHGKVDETNCHPFIFNDNQLALIHNGVLNIKCSIEGLSDTAHFVKLVLEPMVKFNKVPINDAAFNYLICTSIGTDKMAVMDGNGKTYIFNEGKGEWEGGVWYSNTSFRYTYKKTFTAGTYGGGTQGTPANSYVQGATHTPSFKKHWENGDEEDDEAYLQFWKRASALSDKEEVPANTSPDPKTTRLLGPPNHSEIFGNEPKESVDSAGNVTVVDTIVIENEDGTAIADNEHSLGHQCEYGWYDEKTETEISQQQAECGISREEAIIRMFTSRE